MELRLRGECLDNVRCDADNRLDTPGFPPGEKAMCAQTPDGPVWPWQIPVHGRIIGDFEGFGFGWKRWSSGEKGRKWVGEKACYFCIVEDGLQCAGRISIYG